MAFKYKHILLLVDDDVAIVTALETLFQSQGHEIIIAQNGPDALDILQNSGKVFAQVGFG